MTFYEGLQEALDKNIQAIIGHATQLENFSTVRKISLVCNKYRKTLYKNMIYFCANRRWKDSLRKLKKEWMNTEKMARFPLLAEKIYLIMVRLWCFLL